MSSGRIPPKGGPIHTERSTKTGATEAGPHAQKGGFGSRVVEMLRNSFIGRFLKLSRGAPSSRPQGPAIASRNVQHLDPSVVKEGFDSAYQKVADRNANDANTAFKNLESKVKDLRSQVATGSVFCEDDKGRTADLIVKLGDALKSFRQTPEFNSNFRDPSKIGVGLMKHLEESLGAEYFEALKNAGSKTELAKQNTAVHQKFVDKNGDIIRSSEKRFDAAVDLPNDPEVMAARDFGLMEISEDMLALKYFEATGTVTFTGGNKQFDAVDKYLDAVKEMTLPQFKEIFVLSDKDTAFQALITREQKHAYAGQMCTIMMNIHKARGQVSSNIETDQALKKEAFTMSDHWAGVMLDLEKK